MRHHTALTLDAKDNCPSAAPRSSSGVQVQMSRVAATHPEDCRQGSAQSFLLALSSAVAAMAKAAIRQGGCRQVSVSWTEACTIYGIQLEDCRQQSAPSLLSATFSGHPAEEAPDQSSTGSACHCSVSTAAGGCSSSLLHKAIRCHLQSVCCTVAGAAEAELTWKMRPTPQKKQNMSRPLLIAKALLKAATVSSTPIMPIRGSMASMMAAATPLPICTIAVASAGCTAGSS